MCVLDPVHLWVTPCVCVCVCVCVSTPSQAQEDHDALCERLEHEHEEAVCVAQREYEELRAFLTAHNESLLEEARKRFGEAVQQARVSVNMCMCMCVYVCALPSLGLKTRAILDVRCDACPCKKETLCE